METETADKSLGAFAPDRPKGPSCAAPANSEGGEDSPWPLHEGKPTLELRSLSHPREPSTLGFGAPRTSQTPFKNNMGNGIDEFTRAQRPIDGRGVALRVHQERLLQFSLRLSLATPFLEGLVGAGAPSDRPSRASDIQQEMVDTLERAKRPVSCRVEYA